MTKPTVLATIELQDDLGIGQLFYSSQHRGIAVIHPDGSIHDTETGCEAAEATDAIQAAWGRGWSLEWTDAALAD